MEKRVGYKRHGGIQRNYIPSLFDLEDSIAVSGKRRPDEGNIEQHLKYSEEDS